MRCKWASYWFLRDFFGYFLQRNLKVENVALIFKQLSSGATVLHFLTMGHQGFDGLLHLIVIKYQSHCGEDGAVKLQSARGNRSYD
jgi:hypothetical protein